MLKKFLLSFLLFSSLCFAAGQTAEFNFTVPKFISYNSRFEVSLVSTNIQEPADTLSIYINTSERIYVTSAGLKTFAGSRSIALKEEEGSGNVYKLDIDLQELHILHGDFFQIIIQLKPDNVLTGKISIEGIYFKEGQEAGRLESEGEIPSAQLNFYKPVKTAGKCLELKTGDEFNITNTHNVKQLLTEFWLKFNSPDSTFLEIITASGNIFRLGINSSQVLQIDSDNLLIETFPVFLSNRTWNHFAALVIPEEERMVFYCNDILTASFKLNENESGKLQLKFKNNCRSPLYIDLLRFINLKDRGTVRFRDRNYLSYISEGTSLLEQLTFDDQAALKTNEKLHSYTSLELVKSDAPLFPRAPELNVKMLNRTLLLEWSGGDYKQADYYVIEKSSGSSYHQLGTASPDNEREKTYSYLDQDNGDDITYYRIRQVNKDGTSIFSPEVKIGQGFIEPFTIEQNFPNPFNPKTSIEIELLADTEIDIVVYNLEGSEIARLYNGTLNKGIHKFTFNAEGLPSGIYLYKISTPEYSQTRKMILAK